MRLSEDDKMHFEKLRKKARINKVYMFLLKYYLVFCAALFVVFIFAILSLISKITVPELIPIGGIVIAILTFVLAIMNVSKRVKIKLNKSHDEYEFEVKDKVIQPLINDFYYDNAKYYPGKIYSTDYAHKKDLLREIKSSSTDINENSEYGAFSKYNGFAINYLYESNIFGLGNSWSVNDIIEMKLRNKQIECLNLLNTHEVVTRMSLTSTKEFELFKGQVFFIENDLKGYSGLRIMSKDFVNLLKNHNESFDEMPNVMNRNKASKSIKQNYDEFDNRFNVFQKKIDYFNKEEKERTRQINSDVQKKLDAAKKYYGYLNDEQKSLFESLEKKCSTDLNGYDDCNSKEVNALPVELMNQLIELKDFIKCPMCITFHKNFICIAINTDKDLFEIGLEKSLNEYDITKNANESYEMIKKVADIFCK